MIIHNDRGAIGRFLFIVLIIGALVYIAARWWPAHNLMRVSAQMETAVNRQLVEEGVHDSLVRSTVHDEHSQWIFRWVETDRVILPDRPLDLSGLDRRLTVIAHRFYCRVVRSDDASGSMTLTIGLGPVRFQKLVFLKVGSAVPAPVTPTAVGTAPQVAFVIDDVAYETASMDHFAALGVPLTFAILPRDKHCAELAAKATGLHFPVILHLPMEPIDLAHNDPGGAGLYLKMTPEQLHEQFEKDVKSVPYIVGINNHMGSAFTEDTAKMTLVMGWVKEQHLFFLDSRTSTKSVVCRVAKKFNVPCRANGAFLDNSDDVAAIEHELDLVLKQALRDRRTIAIGHYRRKHLIEALAQKLPEFKARGVQIVTLPTFYQ